MRSMLVNTALSLVTAVAIANSSLAAPTPDPNPTPSGSYPTSANEVGDYTVAIDTTGAVSVLDYGAVANDSSFNNTSAFQSALNANAKVYVPAGVFYFNSGSTLNMTTANRLIYGEGTLKTSGTGTRVGFHAAYFDTIEDLIIDGLSFINLNVGWNQVYVSNATVQNCYFEVTADYAEYMTSTTLGLNFDLRTVDDMYFHSIHFNNNTFKNCSRTAIECINQHKNMDSRGPAGVIDSTRITDFQIKGNVFTFDTGFYRHPDLSAGISTPEMCNLTIEDNYIDGYYWGLELGTLNDGTNTVTKNYITGAMPIASSSWTAIRNVEIMQNYIASTELAYSGSYYFGYVHVINSGGNSDWLNIHDNTIIGSVNFVGSDNITYANNDTTGGSADSSTDPGGIYVGDSGDNVSNGHVIMLDNCQNANINGGTLRGGKAQPGIRAKNGSTGTVSYNDYDSVLTSLILNEDTSTVTDGGSNVLV